MTIPVQDACAPAAPRQRPHRGRTLAAAACLALASPLAAAEPLGLDEAIQRATDTSGDVQGARLDADAKAQEAQAVAGLGLPRVDAYAFAGRVATSVNLDVSNVAALVNPVVSGVDQAVPVAQIPPLPNVLSTNRYLSLSSPGVGVSWPIFTGGRIQALHGVAEGRATEARSDLQAEREHLQQVTAERYFGAQLAVGAWRLRQDAVDDLMRHHRDALALEAAGMIARADRLRADVALDDARRELSRAESDRDLACVALQRLVGMDQPVDPKTPLFVHAGPIGSLQSFVDAALVRNTAWSKLDAKRRQADETLSLNGSPHAPTVLAVGNYNQNQSHDVLVRPNWFVGIYLTIPIAGGLDRGALRQAAQLERERVEVMAAQARRDLPTLVEVRWRAVENARARFQTMDATIALARENLRLQEAAFRQAQAPAVEVVDARVTLAKVLTERLQAAYDYDLALAGLLQATGEPERLVELARSAEFQVRAEDIPGVAP